MDTNMTVSKFQMMFVLLQVAYQIIESLTNQPHVCPRWKVHELEDVKETFVWKEQQLIFLEYTN